jgi:hypothetical protein
VNVTVGSLPASSFAPTVSLNAGSVPWSIVSGDFNLDGIPDLAIANQGGGNGNVTVLLGNGSGGFTEAPGSPFAVGADLRAIVVGDFNDDGLPDLAVVGGIAPGIERVFVLVGHGTGSFDLSSTFQLPSDTDALSLALADFNGDGKADLAVALNNSNQVAVLLGDGQGGFTGAPGSPFTTDLGPWFVAIGDFNADGFPDIAVANINTGNGNDVTVLLGNGSGGFSPASGSPFQVGVSPDAIAVADFNGDGVADLATVDTNSNDVTILLSDGRGGFSQAPGSPFPTAILPFSIAAGDFNGDGNVDLVTASGNGPVGQLSVFLGDGHGGFIPTSGAPFALGMEPLSIVVGDFNSDGKADLAVTNPGSNTVSLLLAVGPPASITATAGTPQSTAVGTSFGVALQATVLDANNAPVPNTSVTFTASSSDPTGSFVGTGTTATVLTDASGVATAPAFTASNVSGTYTVNASTGVVTNTAGFTLTNQPGPPAAIAATSGGSQSAVVNSAFPNPLVATVTDSFGNPVPNASVAFTAPTSGASAVFSTTGTNPATVSTNALGVAASPALSANAVSGGPYDVSASVPGIDNPATFPLTNTAVVSSVAVTASPNSSNLSDAVTFTATVTPGDATGKVTFELGTMLVGIAPVNGSGQASITTKLLPSGTAPLRAIYSGDSGHTASTSAPGNVTVHALPGSSFAPAVSLPAGTEPFSIVSGDFNLDGIPDLATANQGSGNVTVLLGTVSGGFTEVSGSPFHVGGDLRGIAVGDFNGDGRPDLAVGGNGSNLVSVLVGDGTGNFVLGPSFQFPVNTFPISLAVADFNGDGKADLAIVLGGSNQVAALLGDGTGHFAEAPGSPFVTDKNPNFVAIGDFNTDGFSDIAVANFGGDNVTVLLGNGSGEFSYAPNSPFPVGRSPNEIAIADFNGDGVVDLATANANGTSVTILLSDDHGGFSQPAGSPFATAISAESIASGDFNGDGNADLVVAGGFDPAGQLVVYLGDGHGGFSLSPGVPFGVGADPWSIAVGDFNRDGKSDLAVANAGNSETGNTVSLLLAVGPPASITATAGTPQSTTVGTPFTVALQATVLDANNAPVPNTSVTFTAPSSDPTGSFVGTGATATVLTDASGVATAPAFTASNIAGTYTVNASTGGVTNTAGFTLTNLPGPPAAIAATSGSGQRAVVNGAFPNPLVATVADSFGNPLSNVSVTFAAPTPGASAVFSTTGTNSAIVSTNTSGVATSPTLSANAVSGGPYNVAASVAGIDTPATFALTNTAASSSVAITASPNPSNLSQAVTLTATVTPSDATGKVTFELGTMLVGTAPVNAGQGSITTKLLPSVAAPLRAIYGGDNRHAASTSAVVNVTVHALPGSSFSPAVSLEVGSGPSSIASGDFNLDGIPDLATANGAGNVTVLLGNGSGGFTEAPGSPFAVGVFLSAIAVGDFNGDGFPDLAVAEVGQRVVSVLIGDGTGSFVLGSVLHFVYVTPISLAVADFNNDGKADLAVVLSEDGPINEVDVLLGDGQGSFTEVGRRFATGKGPHFVVIGDFNADAFPDIAVANDSSNDVTVLLGDGSGNFSPAPGSPFPVGEFPSAIAVADFNGDGIVDLATINSSSADVTILLSDGHGGFSQAPGSPFPTGISGQSIAAGDFNGDGNVDFATAAGTDPVGQLRIFLGDGHGGFNQAPGPSFAVGAEPLSIVVGDFNRDGKTDLAVANAGNSNATSNTVSLLLAVGPPSSITATAGTSQSATVGTAYAVALQAAVLDANNNPVPNASVTFTAPTAGASGTFGAAGNTTTVLTDSSGVATAPAFTANNIAGAYSVSATVSGLATAVSFNVVNTAGAAAALTIVSGSNQSAPVGSGFSPLVVKVTDADGNPLPGVSVTFTAPVSGASGIFTGNANTFNAQTDSSGDATVAGLYANGVAGAYAVVASVAGITGTASFTLTNSASQLTITTSSLPGAIVGTPYSIALSAQGGIGPYSWSKSGSLPAGLTFGTGGLISGTPTAAGSASFMVTVSDSSGQTASETLNLLISPQVSLSVPSDTEPSVTVSNGQVQAQQPPAAPIIGTITLSFDANAAALPTPYVNPGVCFSDKECDSSSAGTNSFTFTIPAGSSGVTIPPLQAGTVAGDILLTLAVPGQATVSSKVTVPQSVPVIEANSVKIIDVTDTGFIVEVVASSSTPRDVETATFTFTPASGAQINGTATFPVAVAPLISQWYASAEGQSYGSAFTLQIPFTTTGSASAIGSVSVTLTNSIGASTAVSGTQ